MSNFFVELCFGALPWYAIAVAAAAAYFLGNVNPAIIIGKAKGIDIREQGSGNAGATNALRSLGKKIGAITFVIDVAKGWAGFFIPMIILKDLPVAMLCGLCVVLGHMYPAVFGFRGGKGVATAFGVFLAASWLYAVILLAVVAIFAAIFRRVSLSVMIAVVVAIILVFTVTAFNSVIDPLWVIIILAFVVLKHRANIARLIKGEEPKLSFGSRKKAETGNEG